MKISKIVFELEPWWMSSCDVEVRCRLELNGEEFNWREILPEDDFTSRAEKYFDYMRIKIMGHIKDK